MKSRFKESFMNMPMADTEAEGLGELRSERAKLTLKDFKGKVDPDWCPGCGDFGVLSALKQALAELHLYPHEVMVISGIGCSSNLPGYISTYGMHTLHGRALPVATGAQLANHNLKIIVTGGDGDGYGIGGNHFLHSMRRNVDLTYIVMNNQIYGLTTGQISPTSIKEMKTKSTPFGSVENALNPVPLAIAAGATYVARGYTGQVKHLVDLIKGGIRHRGFALIDAFSPCVTYNHDNSHEFFKQRTKKLEDTDHDPTDFTAAMKQGYLWGDAIPIGLFWKRDDLPSLDQMEPVLAEGGPLAHRALGVSAETARALIRELM
jgi:2-oxoglutarate ferredoxin oxidoreductase subunit beta